MEVSHTVLMLTRGLHVYKHARCLTCTTVYTHVYTAAAAQCSIVQCRHASAYNGPLHSSPNELIKTTIKGGASGICSDTLAMSTDFIMAPAAERDTLPSVGAKENENLQYLIAELDQIMDDCSAYNGPLHSSPNELIKTTIKGGASGICSDTLAMSTEFIMAPAAERDTLTSVGAKENENLQYLIAELDQIMDDWVKSCPQPRSVRAATSLMDYSLASSDKCPSNLTAGLCNQLASDVPGSDPEHVSVINEKTTGTANMNSNLTIDVSVARVQITGIEATGGELSPNSHTSNTYSMDTACTATPAILSHCDSSMDIAGESSVVQSDGQSESMVELEFLLKSIEHIINEHEMNNDSALHSKDLLLSVGTFDKKCTGEEEIEDWMNQIAHLNRSTDDRAKSYKHHRGVPAVSYAPSDQCLASSSRDPILNTGKTDYEEVCSLPAINRQISEPIKKSKAAESSIVWSRYGPRISRVLNVVKESFLNPKQWRKSGHVELHPCQAYIAMESEHILKVTPANVNGPNVLLCNQKSTLEVTCDGSIERTFRDHIYEECKGNDSHYELVGPSEPITLERGEKFLSINVASMGPACAARTV